MGKPLDIISLDSCAFYKDHVVHDDFEGVVRQWYSMPYQDGDRERFIWGATAGMLRNLYRFLSA